MLTPDDLRRIAELIWYAPTAADAHVRVRYYEALIAEATNKENRP